MSLDLDELAELARQGKRFQPVAVHLDDETAKRFQRMRQDPRRFVPEVFENTWADSERVAEADEMRLLAAVVCVSDVVYVVGRQGGDLFACRIPKVVYRPKKKK
jgi:hypothetical protein